jgi:hypothetical protein
LRNDPYSQEKIQTFAKSFTSIAAISRKGVEGHRCGDLAPIANLLNQHVLIGDE